MTLMIGTGPFGHVPAGIFNTELPREGLLYSESYPRRMRGLFTSETVWFGPQGNPILKAEAFDPRELLAKPDSRSRAEASRSSKEDW